MTVEQIVTWLERVASVGDDHIQMLSREALALIASWRERGEALAQARDEATKAEKLEALIIDLEDGVSLTSEEKQAVAASWRALREALKSLAT